MFKRLLYQKLLDWKNRSSRLPLILRGARQVGKTTLITEFGKNEFVNFITLNLEEREYKSFFSGSFEQTLQAIEFKSKTRINPQNTLLFLDEIQAVPEAVNMLRFFYEKMPGLHVICAGSLLEIKLSKKNISFPTGRVEYLFLAPLSFLEFVEAKGNQVALEILKGRVNTISETVHTMLMEELYSYFRIGGLPGVVRSVLEVKSEMEAVRLHGDLFQSILDDLEKYVHKSEAKYLELAFVGTPFHISERLTYANFHNSEYRSREMKEAFNILEKAFLTFRSLPTSVTSPPILKKNNLAPKLFFFDIGLANSKLKMPFRTGSYEVQPQNKGDFAEQFVFQELLAMQTHIPDFPSFWLREKKDSHAEIDFCYEWNNRLIPVEVKAGTIGRLKSLGVFLNNASLKTAIRISSRPFSVSSNVTTGTGAAFTLLDIPFYFTWRIGEILNEWITENGEKK
jgi:hypothetical protein